MGMGYTCELCAAIIDQEKSLVHIAAEEVGPVISMHHSHSYKQSDEGYIIRVTHGACSTRFNPWSWERLRKTISMQHRNGQHDECVE